MLLDKSRILSDRQLKGLKNHKYNSHSNSICDPYFQPWWNFVVSLMPMWVAPNLITIVGLVINIVTSLILIHYSPTGTEKPPSWAPLLCGLGIFAYQTLDAIDGKQARRTGTSSPLGELFDHGCDSLSTVFVAVASSCTVGLGEYPHFMLFQCFLGSTLFYCAHWQTYVTGQMRFGRIDVTEGQIVVITVMFITGILGPYVWDTNVAWLLPLKLCPTICGGALGIYTLLTTLETIAAGGIGRNGSSIANTSVLTPALPILLVIIPGIVIAKKSEDLIFERHPILYIFTFGLMASKYTNKLIVAHMSRNEIGHRDSSLLAPAALFFNQYFNNFIPEYPLLVLAFLWVVLDLCWYCWFVCVEICDSMNVHLFKITPPLEHEVAATTTPAKRGPGRPRRDQSR